MEAAANVANAAKVSELEQRLKVADGSEAGRVAQLEAELANKAKEVEEAQSKATMEAAANVANAAKVSELEQRLKVADGSEAGRVAQLEAELANKAKEVEEAQSKATMEAAANVANAAKVSELEQRLKVADGSEAGRVAELEAELANKAKEVEEAQSKARVEAAANVANAAKVSELEQRLKVADGSEAGRVAELEAELANKAKEVEEAQSKARVEAAANVANAAKVSELEAELANKAKEVEEAQSKARWKQRPMSPMQPRSVSLSRGSKSQMAVKRGEWQSLKQSWRTRPKKLKKLRVRPGWKQRPMSPMQPRSVSLSRGSKSQMAVKRGEWQSLKQSWRTRPKKLKKLRVRPGWKQRPMSPMQPRSVSLSRGSKSQMAVKRGEWQSLKQSWRTRPKKLKKLRARPGWKQQQLLCSSRS